MHSSERGSSLVPPRQWLDQPAVDSDEISWGLLAGLTLLGATLRVASLTAQSLWVDELLTWQGIAPGHGLHFLEQFMDTIQGPLYLAAAWPLLQLQDSALMLRLPALLAGIVAVPLFGRLAWRTIGGRGARLALLLFALNPFHIWYSQEGRGYAFLVLMAIVTALIYVEMVQKGPTGTRAAAFGLAGAAMVLSNLSGVFLLVAMGLTVALVERPIRGRVRYWWLLGFGLAALLAAPWLLKASGIWAVDRIVPGAAMGTALRGETTFSPLGLFYALYTFFFGYSLGPSLRELHQPDRLSVVLAYWPLLAAGGLAAGSAVLGGLVRLERRRVALLVWIAVPTALAVVLALRNIKPWNPRYLAAVLPWLVLLAGEGLVRLPRRWGFVAAVTLCGLMVWSLAGYYAAGKFAKEDLRQAAELVRQARPASAAVLVPVVGSVYKYYDRQAHLVLGSLGRPALANREEADRFVAETLAGRDFCRVVLAREWYFDPLNLLPPALSRAGHLRLEAEVPGVRIYTWQSKEPRGGQLGS